MKSLHQDESSDSDGTDLESGDRPNLRWQAETRLTKINECFLSFGPDPVANINRLTALCGELLGATCALYSRLQQGNLHAIGQWQPPAEYKSVDPADGHICHDVIQRGGDDPVVIRDLANSLYAATDPNIIRYQLQTYVGQAVKCKGVYVGAICAIDQRDLLPDEADRQALGIIAAAIGIEEERWQAQETLRESEERYRRIIETASEGIWIINAANATTFVNYRMAEMMGYAPVEMLGKTLFEFMDEEGQAIATRYVERRRQGIQEQHDFKFRRQDGSDLWAIVSTNPIFDSSGNYVGSLGMVTDITERRQQAERQRLMVAIAHRIRESLNLEEILGTTVAEVRQLLQADRVFTCRINSHGDGRVTAEAVAPGWPTLIDTAIPTTALLKERHQLYHQGQIQAISNVATDDLPPDLAGLLQQLDVQSVLVAPILQRDLLWGLLVVHQCQAVHQWQPWEIDLLQQLAVQVGIAIQQSELYRQVQTLNADLEQQVQERTLELQLAFEFEATLKRITDKVRDSFDESQILQTAVQELGASLKVSYCHAALYDLNLNTATISYEYLTVPMPAAHERTTQMADFPEIYGQLLQGQYFQFCSGVFYPYWEPVVILTCPILDDQGVFGDLRLIHPKYDSFSNQDIRLVQQVANQCAIAIRQARLYQAAQNQVQELARLNHLKDDFLSTISHELRTPIASVRMASQMLEITLKQLGILEQYASSVGRYLQVLQTECDREISLINDLLDLSELEAETTPLALTEISLHEWLCHIIEPFAERIKRQHQQLQVNLPASLPVFVSDLAKLGRLLAELLNNACKYTPAEGIIDVTVQTQANILCISIRNFGIEIPPQELVHIFDKFYRIPNNDPWKHSGTGLGLALAKKLAERLQGNIQATSAEGWTTFTLQLPYQLQIGGSQSQTPPQAP